MSVDYNLHLANSGTDENLIKKVLKDMSIEAVGRDELDLGVFSISEKKPARRARKPSPPPSANMGDLEGRNFLVDFV